MIDALVQRRTRDALNAPNSRLSRAAVTRACHLHVGDRLNAHRALIHNYSISPPEIGMRAGPMVEEPETIPNPPDDTEITVEEEEEPQNGFPAAESVHLHESMDGASVNSQEPVHANGFGSHLVESPHGSTLDDESDTAESSEEEEDEDEDEEPALKYEKLGGSAQELLEKDTASALAVAVNKLVSYLVNFGEHQLTLLLGNGYAQRCGAYIRPTWKTKQVV